MQHETPTGKAIPVEVDHSVTVRSGNFAVCAIKIGVCADMSTSADATAVFGDKTHTLNIFEFDSEEFHTFCQTLNVLLLAEVWPRRSSFMSPLVSTTNGSTIDGAGISIAYEAQL
jgi:hypothetical protein